jgi:hypothetical protein
VIVSQHGEPLPDMTDKEYPQLLATVAADGQTISCVLACDGKVIPAGTSIIEALDFMYKFMWIFLLKYHPGLSGFYKFLQFSVYKLSYGKERPSSTVVEVTKLFNM